MILQSASSLGNAALPPPPKPRANVKGPRARSEYILLSPVYSIYRIYYVIPPPTQFVYTLEKAFDIGLMGDA